MLTWVEMEHGNGYIGFDDDCPRYFVRKDEDGWYWEDDWGFGYGGLETAEEAKAAAEDDAEAHDFYEEEEESLLDVLDDDGEWDAYWDAVAHERMEIAKGLF